MTAKAPATRRARRAIYDDAVAVVREEYADDLRPDAVAGRVATSRRQLQRVFAEVGGTTFAAHLTRVRLERAAELLGDGARPVREIGQAVGFRSPGGFSVAFRRHYGVPPRAMRRGRGSGTRQRQPQEVAAGEERPAR